MKSVIKRPSTVFVVKNPAAAYWCARNIVTFWWQRWDLRSTVVSTTHIAVCKCQVYMSTRSGRQYSKRIEGSEMSEREYATTAGAVNDVMRILLEDRRNRELQVEEERRQREREVGEEREQLRDQLEVLRGMWEDSRQEALDGRAGGRAARNHWEGELKLTKLSEQDDIEAYLTTYERMMVIYEVPEERWAVRLAPLLTGKAQSAYAAMRAEDALDYRVLKEAILKRYEISEDSYRQKFRRAEKKAEESVSEMAVRLNDFFRRWTRSCATVEQLADLMVKEQLLNTLPVNVKIWVEERRPKTAEEAAQLADDYFRARKQATHPFKQIEGKTPMESQSTRRCYTCKQPGHFAKDCPVQESGRSESAATGKNGRESESNGVVARQPGEKRDWTKIECYNCGKKGHGSRYCPNNALYCAGRKKNKDIQRSGVVNGQRVEDIVLDTGCSQTMVHSRLIPSDQLLEVDGVVVRCVHGDSALYPLCNVRIELEGRYIQAVAAVSDTLPTSVLLGTDVSELGKLLGMQIAPKTTSPGEQRAYMVTTRAKEAAEASKEQEERSNEQESGVSPNPVAVESGSTSTEGEVWDLGNEMDDCIFEGGYSRPKQTRRQKRRGRRNLQTAELELDTAGQQRPETDDVLASSAEELRASQEADPTLVAVREAVSGAEDDRSSNYFKKDGLLYHRRKHAAGGAGEDSAVEQLVLPKKFRKAVLNLAHSVPTAGHLGKRKTADRILQRFHWPGVHRDVASYCKGCAECQKLSRGKVCRVPLVPLPVISVPFERIAMDIVGPLPRSSHGNRYVLVVCDYATRYPEAMAMRSVEAERVAEELVTLFARVGIPKEILTDQGTNFTSMLLQELYRLLHIRHIRTSPYHPQTDGLVERFNRTLKMMLRKTAVEEGKDWDRLLPYVLFAYREVPQSSTGFSPFELLYGRAPRGPLDVLKETWERASCHTS